MLKTPKVYLKFHAKGKKLFEAKNIVIEFDKQQYLYVNWKGFQTVDIIKSGCEKMLELLKKSNAAEY